MTRGSSAALADAIEAVTNPPPMLALERGISEEVERNGKQYSVLALLTPRQLVLRALDRMGAGLECDIDFSEGRVTVGQKYSIEVSPLSGSKPKRLDRAALELVDERLGKVIDIMEDDLKTRARKRRSSPQPMPRIVLSLVGDKKRVQLLRSVREALRGIV